MAPPTGKSGAMSGESFGMNPLKSGTMKPGYMKDSRDNKRMIISDNFLEEEDEDDENNTIRASAESGEI